MTSVPRAWTPSSDRVGGVHTYLVALSPALRCCSHSGINVRVECDLFDARMMTVMLPEKVRMLHLHTASIEVRQASPRHRCTLTLLFAHASAHATRFRHRRSMFDQQDGTGTRWRSCCGPLRRHSIVGVVLLQKPGALRRSSQALSWCCNGRDGWYRVASGGCARGCSLPSMSLACAT